MIFLEIEHVVKIHERLVALTGESHTVLDMGKLESAVAQPRMTFDGADLYPTLAEKAAALAFSLNKNHAFENGNKRVSHAAVEMFLLQNGHEIEAGVDEQERVWMAVADSRMSREDFAAWVCAHVAPRRR